MRIPGGVLFCFFGSSLNTFCWVIQLVHENGIVNIVISTSIYLEILGKTMNNPFPTCSFLKMCRSTCPRLKRVPAYTRNSWGLFGRVPGGSGEAFGEVRGGVWVCVCMGEGGGASVLAGFR